MKVGLFYYSGTGSTAYFAHYIGQKLVERQMDVSYLRITRACRIKLDDYDLIGIGVPVWVWRAPRVITKLISTWQLPQKYFFSFITCGGTPGNAAWSIYKALKKSGGIYMGDVVARGPNNIRRWRPSFSKPDEVGDALNEKDLGGTETFINNLLEKLEKSSQLGISQIQSHPPNRGFKWSVLGSISTYRWEMQVFVGNKILNVMKCTKCGLCVQKICPSGAITLDNERRPIFNEKICDGCMGCINLCPTLAIETRSAKNHQPFLLYKQYILGN